MYSVLPLAHGTRKVPFNNTVDLCAHKSTVSNDMELEVEISSALWHTYTLTQRRRGKHVLRVLVHTGHMSCGISGKSVGDSNQTQHADVKDWRSSGASEQANK